MVSHKTIPRQTTGGGERQGKKGDGGGGRASGYKVCTRQQERRQVRGRHDVRRAAQVFPIFLCISSWKKSSRKQRKGRREILLEDLD